ncbi:hypothetical protein [Amycolatopsis sp. NPDC004378]
MVDRREHAIAWVRWLRDQTPPLPVLDPQDWMGQLAADRRQAAEKAVRESIAELTQDRIGPEVISGSERVELAAWLTRITRWWTPQETLAALDDLVAGLALDEILCICRSEGFAQVAETERDGDRFVWLLDDDGLLGLVYLARDRTGPPQPWSLTVYGNRMVEDPGLWIWNAGCMSKHEVLPDGRWIVVGDRRWHLRYPSSSGGSFRAALAMLRATTSPITPWQYPAIKTWIGPDSPHGMIGAPRDEIARTARGHTRDALAELPDHVRAVLGAHPMHA